MTVIVAGDGHVVAWTDVTVTVDGVQMLPKLLVLKAVVRVRVPVGLD